MRFRRIDGRPKEESRSGFASRAILAGTLLAGACAPEVNIHNKFYDPNAPPDAGCTSIASCAPQTVFLREKGNSSGSSEGKAGNLAVRLLQLVDSGSTKAARIELEGCDKKAEGTFAPGAASTLTVGRDSFTIRLESLEFDAAGLKVSISVTPACSVDQGAKAKDSGKRG